MSKVIWTRTFRNDLFAAPSADAGRDMTHSVFWSWQSDAPKRETRDVIHDALKAALEELAAELEEAKRFEVGQGAGDVLGMELIAEVILDKIDRSFAFVGDISTVATIGEGLERKCIANPNVMLELGYARRALGRNRIIPVFNSAIGPTRFEDLPFDLRHMSGSILFSLPEGAPKAELRTARDGLKKQLLPKLRAMLAIEEAAPEETGPIWHDSLLHDPSLWEEGYNPLPVILPRVGQLDIIAPKLPRLFVRLLPVRQGMAPRPSANAPFPDFTEPLLPIGNPPINIRSGRSRNGHVAFEAPGEDRTTTSIARWYKDTGEIWAITSWPFLFRGTIPHLAYDQMIKELAHWIPRAVRCSRIAGAAGPFSLRLGAVDLRNVQWWNPNNGPDANPIRGLEDLITHEHALADDNRGPVVDAICEFFEKLTDNFAADPLSREQIATLAQG